MNERSEHDRLLGRLEARLQALEAGQESQAKDLREVRDVLLKARGGWKTLVAVGSISGVVGAAAAKLMPFLTALPK